MIANAQKKRTNDYEPTEFTFSTMVKGPMKRLNLTISTALFGAMMLALLVASTTTSIAQPPPTTANTFRMFNSAGNYVDINATGVTGTHTFSWPAASAGIFMSDATGQMSIGQIDAADFEMALNSLLLGGGAGNPSTELVSPGAAGEGQVLQIDATGAPSWETINELPDGTTDNSTLVWDATAMEWVENDQVTMDPTTGDIETAGDVDAAGDLTVDGNTTLGDDAADQVVINAGDVEMTNLPGPTATLPNQTTGGGILVTDQDGNVTEVTPDAILGETTLSEDALWVGDVNDNPSELPAGTDEQVLMIDGTTPTWTDINLLPDGTVDNATLVWDDGTDSWIENPNVTMDPTTGDIETVGGIEAAGNSQLGDDAGDQVVIEAGDVEMTNLPTNAGPLAATDNVLITDAAGNVSETSPDNIVGAAELSENALWVGDATDSPVELAAPALPAGADQVLQINSTTGAPTWQSINVLPTGTTDNSTLVWDNTAMMWVENDQVTMDPTTGDIETAGDVDAAGDVTVDGNTTLGDDAADAVVINAGDVQAPNLPVVADGAMDDENIMIVDPVTGVVSQTSPDNIVDAADLSENALWMGDATDSPIELAAGTSDQVLQINDVTGAPTWQDINLLPDGTLQNSTLVWDDANGEWIENTQVTMHPTTGNVNLTNGDLSTNGDVDANDLTLVGDAILGNGAGDEVIIADEAPEMTNLATTTAPDVNDDAILVIDPTTNEVTRASPDDVFGATTLNENALWVGDANDNPSELATSGTEGDVLTVSATGAPVWTTPAGGIESYGQVTGDGANWQYTVSPTGGIPAGAVIMIQMTSATGLQITNSISSISAASFTVDFPVVLGAGETFHWVIVQ